MLSGDIDSDRETCTLMKGQEIQAGIKSVPRHQRLRVGAALAWVGGFLESYTYLLHGGVFANAQTGNLVLLVLELCRGSAYALYYCFPIASFCIGVWTVQWLRHRLAARHQRGWHFGVAAVEAMLLAVIALLPPQIPSSVVITVVSLICAMQFQTFRRAHGLPYATTFCTGNMRSLVESTFGAAVEQRAEGWREAGRYIVVVLAFVGGVAVGAFAIKYWNKQAMWLCVFVLTAVCIYLKAGLRSVGSATERNSS